tara:strand:- start:453 stop:1448 length:996 start_codon:yes stop_codon:yes gene_type:complete
MNLYIDKGNLLSLIQSRSESMYDDCVNLLKKQLNIYFNFSKNDLKEEDILMTWFVKNFGDGVGQATSLNWDADFPPRPLKSNSANGFNSTQLSSVFLLEDVDFIKLQKSETVLLGGVGEEISTLNQLFFFQKDYLFEKKWRIGDNEFERWSDLKSFSLPLTEILIIDPYILKNKDTDTDTVDINFIEFLGVLAERSNGKINIIVVTQPDNMDWDYKELKEKVTAKLIAKTGKKPNVTLIKTKREHDRTILTNYKRIYSGDTFNFWNKRGVKITKGREIMYASLGNIENHSMAIKLIEDVQGTISFLERNNPDYIEGDKKSKYLNFNKLLCT